MLKTQGREEMVETREENRFMQNMKATFIDSMVAHYHEKDVHIKKFCIQSLNSTQKNATWRHISILLWGRRETLKFLLLINYYLFLFYSYVHFLTARIWSSRLSRKHIPHYNYRFFVFQHLLFTVTLVVLKNCCKSISNIRPTEAAQQT